MRILFIEDDHEYAHLIQTFLANSALMPELDYVRTVHEGIAKADAASEPGSVLYDLVLLDLLLPDSDIPIETYQRVSTAVPNTPIVVMTSMYDEYLIKNLIDQGARSYLIKPQTNRSLLIRTIEFVLENQRIRNSMATIQTTCAQDREELDELLEARTKELSTATAQISMREQMLALIVELQHHLLSSVNTDDVAKVYMQLVERIGEVSGAGRAYIFNVARQHSNEILLELSAEWTAQNVVPAAGSGLYSALPYGQFVPFWTEAILNAGDILHEDVAGWDEPLRRLHAERNTQSILLLPILVDGSLEGIIGLDRTISGHDLNTTSIELLSGFTAELALWLERRQANEKMKGINLELRSRNSELDAYAHTVAHDLKNPLSILVSTISLLTESNIALSAEEEEQLMLQIGMYAERATNIVDELLLLANSTRNEVSKKPVNMAEVFNSSLINVRHLINERNASIIQPDSWPMAVGYAPWLEVVWVNYLSNALKYGGTPPIIEVGAKQLDDGSTEFWIQDNGRGLTEQQQQQLFAPFKAIGDIPTGGHGLGLSIVRRVLDKLEGRVSVSSEGVKGKGSRFSFTLPSLVTQM